MGTLNGAEAFGRDSDVGSITAGKLANLVALPIPDDTTTQTTFSPQFPAEVEQSPRSDS